MNYMDKRREENAHTNKLIMSAKRKYHDWREETEEGFKRPLTDLFREIVEMVRESEGKKILQQLETKFTERG